MQKCNRQPANCNLQPATCKLQPNLRAQFGFSLRWVCLLTCWFAWLAGWLAGVKLQVPVAGFARSKRNAGDLVRPQTQLKLTGQQRLITRLGAKQIEASILLLLARFILDSSVEPDVLAIVSSHPIRVEAIESRTEPNRIGSDRIESATEEAHNYRARTSRNQQQTNS